MLRKLIKHELIATGRIMLPIFSAVLIAAFGGHFAAFNPSPKPTVLPVFLISLIEMLFVLSLFVAFIAAFVLMIRRFYCNLLREEGYLTMTLPVSVHEHMSAKVIVSVLWSLSTVLVACVAFAILFFQIGWIDDMFALIRDILKALIKEGLFLHGVGIGLELLALMIAGIASVCLQFYAAMAIGHSFTSRKGLCSFAAYFALQFALQAVYALIARIAGATDIITAALEWLEDTVVVTTLENGGELIAPSLAGIHIVLLVFLAAVALQGAVFYAITAYCLKNRLNLN